MRTIEDDVIGTDLTRPRFANEMPRFAADEMAVCVGYFTTP